MSITLLLFLQATASLTGTAPKRTFDLRQLDEESEPLDLSGRCSVAESDEILVCARRESRNRYRLPLLPPGHDPSTTRAEAVLGAARVGIGTEAASIGGVQSNRVMARMKLKF